MGRGPWLAQWKLQESKIWPPLKSAEPAVSHWMLKPEPTPSMVHETAALRKARCVQRASDQERVAAPSDEVPIWLPVLSQSQV